MTNICTTTPYVIPYKLVLSSDGVTPATGKTPVVFISKAGSAFAAPVGLSTEIGNGWYALAATPTDTNTLGELIVEASGSSTQLASVTHTIVGYDPENGVIQTSGFGPKNFLIPATPTGLAGTASGGHVSLTWTAVSNATGYTVYREGLVLATTTTPAFTDTTPGAVGTQVHYQVVATLLGHSSMLTAVVIVKVA